MASLSKHALVGRVTPVRAVAESGRWRAKDPPALPLLQQNALDGVPLCFMLPRFSRPNRARGEGSCEDRPPQADERASSRAGEFLLINNSCSMDFSAGYPATLGSI